MIAYPPLHDLSPLRRLLFRKECKRLLVERRSFVPRPATAGLIAGDDEVVGRAKALTGFGPVMRER